jgi:hypothetical protein
MEEAEIYYQEANNTHRWGEKAFRQDVQYAFKATNSKTETKEEKEKQSVSSYEETIKALTAPLQEYATAYTARWSGPNIQDMDKKYA